MEIDLLGWIKALEGFITTVGFDTWNVLGAIWAICLAAISIMLIAGYDFKVWPKPGIIKFRQSWGGSKALSIMALTTAAYPALALATGGFITIIPGVMSFWGLGLAVIFGFPIVFGLPGGVAIFTGMGLFSLIKGTLNIASLWMLEYLGISWIIWKICGTDPGLTTAKSWAKMIFAYAFTQIFLESLGWAWAEYVLGVCPAPVAYLAYMGGSIMQYTVTMIPNLIMTRVFYTLAKRWGLYWRDIPGYYSWEYVSAKKA